MAGGDMMKEKEIEKILVDEVRKLGGRAYKFVSPGNDGVPDRIVIFPDGRPIFTELKTDTGKLSALQSMQLKRLDDLGQYTRVIRGIAGLRAFFEEQGFWDTASRIAARYDL